MKENIRPKQNRQPLLRRLYCMPFYMFSMLDGLNMYSAILIRKFVVLRKIANDNPFLRFYITNVVYRSGSSFFIFYIYYHLFVRKNGAVFKVHFFVKHHIIHSIMIPITWYGFEQLIWLLVGGRRGSKNRGSLALILLIIYTLIVVSFAQYALQGKYFTLPIISESAEYHTGPFPKSELEEIDKNGNVIDESPEAPLGMYPPRNDHKTYIEEMYQEIHEQDIQNKEAEDDENVQYIEEENKQIQREIEQEIKQGIEEGKIRKKKK
mmetsp:Transcript_4444/g.14989  ORF Transcript_4444/g.14989 Transcript_4444/m.14989 type:complete len:265 (+) Transcript_4444:117-911(+)